MDSALHQPYGSIQGSIEVFHHIPLPRDTAHSLMLIVVPLRDHERRVVEVRHD
ncbi:hypothetical protein [Streptomyces sp. NBC_00236]|uniref:hypothetical protein n=1 Tax=Streptomyces sp. NBC_00236 TaxID=2903639 RepID=UPI002E28CED7|nr:hypothetical protein [Streptomyces sp. NBC_00236]